MNNILKYTAGIIFESDENHKYYFYCHRNKPKRKKNKYKINKKTTSDEVYNIVKK